MPITRTSSDLQRNISEVYELCEQHDQPVYITRNGHADLVVMSARAYEQQALLSQQVRAYEMELRDRANRTYEEMRAGKEKSLEQINREMGLT
ncbi:MULTISPECIES: type II toxin-antitoxin system prevent-host-death family antitoxin [unclassified Adlercreutzia]|uniref:type II toxin-antitoxin system prevent-host-death family antitoxin n=1 Tax=unclassified Adlercreutzia TaxID=2636013 RepID=UPI0013EBA49D|nr:MULTISPECIES: type II toxin-antitoxin system prevent-host-death family antitoxin [unclassified Adlercreutzia]